MWSKLFIHCLPGLERGGEAERERGGRGERGKYAFSSRMTKLGKNQIKLIDEGNSMLFVKLWQNSAKSRNAFD